MPRLAEAFGQVARPASAGSTQSYAGADYLSKFPVRGEPTPLRRAENSQSQDTGRGGKRSGATVLVFREEGKLHVDCESFACVPGEGHDGLSSPSGRQGPRYLSQPRPCLRLRCSFLPQKKESRSSSRTPLGQAYQPAQDPKSGGGIALITLNPCCRPWAETLRRTQATAECSG